MHYFASDEDKRFAGVLARWGETARYEIDVIGDWRDRAAELLVRGWPRGPKNFLSLTRVITMYLRSNRPDLNANAVEEIYHHVKAWHTDKNANRLPPQNEMNTMLERALFTVNDLLQAIAIRPQGNAAAPGRLARKKGCAMPNDSTRKAADLRKVAEALRAWEEFKGADSPEAREAARTALELAVRHLGIMMTVSTRYGCHGPAAYALHWVQQAASERRFLDFEKCNLYWRELTQPRETGGPRKLGLPDELERWADELEKAEDVLALPHVEGERTPAAPHVNTNLGEILMRGLVAAARKPSAPGLAPPDLEADLASHQMQPGGRAATKAKQDKPKLDAKNLRVQVTGKWYDINQAAHNMLKILFEAKGAWVGGKNIGHYPHKTREAMPRAVANMITTHRTKGYCIPSLRD